MNASLARLSICPCGYPALKTDIDIGTVYEVTPGSEDTFNYTCGRCGHTQVIRAVEVCRDGGGCGYLPKELFDLE